MMSTRDVGGLLCKLAVFDHTEGIFGKSSAEIALERQLEDARDNITRLTEENKEIAVLRNQIATATQEKKSLKELVNKLQEQKNDEVSTKVRETLNRVPQALIPDECEWAKTHEVIAFVVISPDKKSAYAFSLQGEKVGVFNDATFKTKWRAKPKERLSSSVDVRCAMECESVSAMLKMYDMTRTDKVLNFNWQEIMNWSASLQSFIVLESISRGRERATQRQRELEAERDRKSREEVNGRDSATIVHGHTDYYNL